jgi:hypothetical protein
MSRLNQEGVAGVTKEKWAKKKTVDLGEKGSFTEHPGALHKALGVPQGENIPAKDLEGKHSGRLGRMVASAKGFKAMAKK